MPLGYHHTEETRARMSSTAMGNTYSLGRHQSEETKALISAAEKGKVVSLETCAKLSAAGMGHITSPETKARLSAAEKGKVLSPETCAKMSAAQMGHVISTETRAKIGAGRWRGGREVSSRKFWARRRTLGFNPLNSWFLGCEGHHINKDDVIHLPRKLHRSVSHNQVTGRNMDKMNAIAGQYLTEGWT